VHGFIIRQPQIRQIGLTAMRRAAEEDEAGARHADEC